MSQLAKYRQLDAVVFPVDTEPVSQFVIDNGYACCAFGICVERIRLGAVSGINLHRRLEGQRYGENLRRPIGCLD